MNIFKYEQTHQHQQMRKASNTIETQMARRKTLELSTNNPLGRHYFHHHTDDRIEAQRGKVIYPKSHSQ